MEEIVNGDRPRKNHPNPWLRIVETEQEFQQVKKEIEALKRGNLQFTRINEGFLETMKYVALPVINREKISEDGDLWFFANEWNDIILPHHRKYWQNNQTKYWMYCSGGYGVFVQDISKKNYLILALRTANVDYGHSLKLDLFNGSPSWQRAEDSHFSKEIVGQRSTAKKRLVERLFMYDTKKKRTLYPGCILGDDFTTTDAEKAYASSSKNAFKIVKKDLDIRAECRPQDSRFVALNGSCTMNLIVKRNGKGDKYISDLRRNVLPVFGTDYGGNRQNLDAISALKVYYDDEIQNLLLAYGDEDEVTGEPLNYTLVAVECDQNNKPKMPLSYDCVWYSGKVYDAYNWKSEIASYDPEITRALTNGKMTPVTHALCESFGCKTGVSRR